MFQVTRTPLACSTRDPVTHAKWAAWNLLKASLWNYKFRCEKLRAKFI